MAGTDRTSVARDRPCFITTLLRIIESFPERSTTVRDGIASTTKVNDETKILKLTHTFFPSVIVVGRWENLGFPVVRTSDFTLRSTCTKYTFGSKNE